MATDADRAGAPATFGVVVLISGGGSNLQALLDARATSRVPIDIRAVISNVATAFGLERARRADVPALVLDHRAFAARADFDAALAARIDALNPNLVALAGFMRILTPEFAQRYQGRLLNIHPSLLPALRGLHTHQRALDAGARVHGATVHFVTAELDGGPPILQARVAVRPDDDAPTLAARVLEQEHRIYPEVLRWCAERRLSLGADGVPLLDGQPLREPLIWDTTGS